MSKLTPIILIIFSVLLFFVFIDPKRAEITQLQAEKKQYDEVLAKSRDLLDLRDELLEKYKSVSEDDKARLELMLPNNVDNVRLVLDIDKLATEKRVAVKGITVSNSKQIAEQKPDTATGGNLGTATVSFSVTTTYDLFIDFLRSLEDSLRIIDITSLSISAGPGGNNNYTLTLKTYWLK